MTGPNGAERAVAAQARLLALQQASPVPALHDAMRDLRKVLLADDPSSLRRSVGMLGRLLGDDIALQAESDALRTRIGVLLHDADHALAAIDAYASRLSALRQDMLACADALDDAIHAQSCLLSAAHIALMHDELDRLALHVREVLPRVRLLLDQRRMLRADADLQRRMHATLDSIASITARPLPTPTPALHHGDDIDRNRA